MPTIFYKSLLKTVEISYIPLQSLYTINALGYCHFELVSKSQSLIPRICYHAYDCLQVAFNDNRNIFPTFPCSRFTRLMHSGIVILNLFQNHKALSLASVTTPTTVYKSLLTIIEISFPHSHCSRFIRLTHSGTSF